MLPSTRRGILLFVSDEENHGVASGVEGESVLTRSPSALSAADAPSTDWVIIDADVLGPHPPSWLDALTSDVYVLASAETTLPGWVQEAELPVLDPALVDLVADVTSDADSTLTMRSGPTATTAAAGRDRDDESDEPLSERFVGSPADTAGDSPATASDDEVADTVVERLAGDHAVDLTAGVAERFEMLSVVPFPVALLDHDGVIRFVNGAWEQFGSDNGRCFTETDVGTDYVAVCEQADDTYAAAAAKSVRRVVTGEADDERVEYPCHGEGERRWYEMNVVSMTGHGQLCAAVLHHDVSQYRQQINVLDRVLRHNLRNKANIILGHAAALASERDDETATAATTIGAAARELLSLSEQARRYREVSSDERPTTPIDVVSVVTEVTERLSRKHPDAVIETTLPAAAVVRGTQSLSLVVHEVVENAIVHNDRANPWVRVEVVRVHEGGDERVSIRVSDDGPGIPTEDRRLLTGGLEEHPIRHGSQLGVWVVSSLVTSLDGTVVVEPRAPHGSVVTMTFPSVTVDG